MLLYKTIGEAEKALRAYIEKNPAIGIYCKKNFFRICCPDCPFRETCRSFDYESSDMDKRLYQIYRRGTFPCNFIPKNIEEALKNKRLTERINKERKIRLQREKLVSLLMVIAEIKTYEIEKLEA